MGPPSLRNIRLSDSHHRVTLTAEAAALPPTAERLAADFDVASRLIQTFDDQRERVVAGARPSVAAAPCALRHTPQL